MTVLNDGAGHVYIRQSCGGTRQSCRRSARARLAMGSQSAAPSWAPTTAVTAQLIVGGFQNGSGCSTQVAQS
jgi:hypothetical protein